MMLLFCGCAEEQTASFLMNTKEPSQASGTVYLLGYHFSSENPLFAKNKTNRDIFSLIYDSLYTIDETLLPTEKLAAGLVMETETSYLLTLKSGILFHDGSVLTATDVVRTVEFLLQNETDYRYYVRNIASVAEEGSGTVRFQLTEPAQNFKAQLIFPIVSSKALQSDEQRMNGTGRYRVENYVQRKKLVLAVSDMYYEPFSPEVTRIEIQLVPDKATANYAYSSGIADVYAQNILDGNVGSVSKSDSGTVEYTCNEYGCILLQMSHPVFQEANVRKAISMAIPREQLVTDVLFSHAVRAETPVHPSSAMCHEELVSPYQPEEAKALLKQSGWETDPTDGLWKRGNEVLEFSLLLNDDSDFKKQLAATVKEQLSQIGIRVSLEEKSFPEYQQAYESGQFQAILVNMEIGFDWDFTSLLATDKNICGYTDPAMDRIFEDISRSETKQEGYLRFQELFLQTMPHISLYYTKNSLLSTSKLKSGLNPIAFSIYHNIENWSF